MSDEEHPEIQYCDLFDDRGSFEYPSGWTGLLSELCTKLARLQRQTGEGIKIHNIKEKFGFLRISVETNSREASAVVDRVIEKSRKTCQACGQGGRLHCGQNHYHQVLCSECAEGWNQQWSYIEDESFSDEEDEADDEEEDWLERGDTEEETIDGDEEEGKGVDDNAKEVIMEAIQQYSGFLSALIIQQCINNNYNF